MDHLDIQYHRLGVEFKEEEFQTEGGGVFHGKH